MNQEHEEKQAMGAAAGPQATEVQATASRATGGADDQQPTTESAGLIRGIPSRRIKTAGVLDLRGVPAEEVAKIESIEMAGVVLADEANRAALGKVKMNLAGTVAVVPPDLRIIIQPELEVSKGMVEAMAPGQKLMIVGNVFFKPEVPAALAAERFEDLRIVGILVVCEGVVGALFGKLEITGITVSLPNDVGNVVRAVGQAELTTGYLSRLADRTTYVSVGQTTIASDVTEELLGQKIVSYHNIGQTSGPVALISLLQSRCATNLGQFEVAEAEEGAEGATVNNFGERKLTRAFLERLQDNSHYENFGRTVIEEDIPEELLTRKLRSYRNFGRTEGPARLLASLEDRCVENFGVFIESGQEEQESREDQESEREASEPHGDSGARTGSATAHFENHDELTLTRADLELIEDGAHFVNHGELTFAEDVPQDLLSRKIGYYENHGTIYAPAPLLSVFKIAALRGRGKNHGELEEC
jgi:hypothetical protein